MCWARSESLERTIGDEDQEHSHQAEGGAGPLEALDGVSLRDGEIHEVVSGCIGKKGWSTSFSLVILTD